MVREDWLPPQVKVGGILCMEKGEMPFTVGDVLRVLGEVRYDMCISYETAKEVFDMTHKARYKQFPGELEKHAMREEAKYARSHPDASISDLMDVRQEYLVAEILELSSNAAKDRMKNDVASDDVSLAIRNDPELNTLFKDPDEGSTPEIPDSTDEAKLRLRTMIDDLIQHLEKIRDSL